MFSSVVVIGKMSGAGPDEHENRTIALVYNAYTQKN